MLGFELRPAGGRATGPKQLGLDFEQTG